MANRISGIRIKYFIAVLLIFVMQQIASRLGGSVANLFTYEWIDQSNVFAWISVHHIIQMIFAIALIAFFHSVYKIDFGFSLGDYKTGMKYVAIFSIVFLVYTGIGYALSYFNNTLSDYTYPLNFNTVIGTLSFQLFLSGTSEEILFRALPISLLIFVSGSSIDLKIGKFHFTLEIIIAALLFSAAHINWTIAPFSLSYSAFQLVYAFVLGLVYGKAYQMSKSVIYPMLMHGISNFVMVGTGYLVSVFL